MRGFIVWLLLVGVLLSIALSQAQANEDVLVMPGSPVSSIFLDFDPLPIAAPIATPIALPIALPIATPEGE